MKISGIGRLRWRALPILFLCAVGAGMAADAESAFVAENAAAMDKMMAAMEVKPSGDIDRDFVEMMVPHHQGAIDMAQAELRYGRNEQLRRIAQEIIVDQQQEIAAMRLALGQPLPPSVASPTQTRAATAMDMPNLPSTPAASAAPAASNPAPSHHHSM